MPVQRTTRGAHLLLALATGAAAVNDRMDGWIHEEVSSSAGLSCPQLWILDALAFFFLSSGKRKVSTTSHMPFALFLLPPSPSLPLPLSSPQVFFAFSDGAVFAVCPIVPANV